MDTTQLVIITNDHYTLLCLFLGLGWGLWSATLTAAIIIDRAKWENRMLGR